MNPPLPTAGLWAAAKANDADLLGRLLEQGYSINERDHRGYAPLMLAAYAGNLEALDFLLSRGADPNTADLFGNTDHGLHMAALAGSWTTLVMGFAGMRVEDDVLCFDPVEIPGFADYRCTIAFRGAQVDVAVGAKQQ